MVYNSTSGPDPNLLRRIGAVLISFETCPQKKLLQSGSKKICSRIGLEGDEPLSMKWLIMQNTKF